MTGFDCLISGDFHQRERHKVLETKCQSGKFTFYRHILGRKHAGIVKHVGLQQQCECELYPVRNPPPLNAITEWHKNKVDHQTDAQIWHQSA